MKSVRLNENHSLRFTTNGMVEFEEKTGEDFLKVATKLERGGLSFKMVRLLIWAGLIHEHEDENGKVTLTEKQAGDIIDEVGFEEVIEKLPDAIGALFPKQFEEKKGQAKNSLKTVAK